MITSYSLPKSQAGATFATGLIFLVVLTLFGTTAMRTAGLEERMSGNLRDRNLALQAAEMALRYAEQHIRDNDPATNTPSPIDGVTGFDNVCTNGLCYYGAGVSAPGEPGNPGNPAWVTYCTPDCPISYVPGTVFNVDGVNFTAPALPAGVPAPTYIIEGIRKTPPGNGVRYYYRITARALGAKQGTEVQLQEIFRP
ncbi:type IV pilus assembly protein PilX [Nitrosomonas marina]|uniref:Type IV pilus assembly protein PilX n=1 Tax=Nitrosomonas marina TaxID=917 RepID=A0A1I0BBF1_9PROT|nr:PilX N-terminal domain-containing pilus assembly protein [Nitrosomonas marina]SET04143.1 type IV pilus assembly protein PilX [Nitrosomonas marina]